MALNLIKKDESRSVVSIKLDEQEFHNIFKEYYAALCSFAFQYMEDADMSADIVQDVFAKLWQIRDDFFYIRLDIHTVNAFFQQYRYVICQFIFLHLVYYHRS